METPRKFTMAELSIRKLVSSSVLIIMMNTDEDPSLRIAALAIINLRGVSTKFYFNLIFTMQTYKELRCKFVTNVWYVKNILANCDGNMYLPILHLPKVELHCKLQEKLHCVAGPLEMSNERRFLKKVSHYCLGLQKFIKLRYCIASNE